MPKPNDLNAYDINGRLIRQVARVLDDLEDRNLPIGPKERIMALLAIGRLQMLFVALRKRGGDSDNAGSSVRKYSKAFKTHASGGRKGAARPVAEELADLDDDDDTDAA